MNRRRQTTLAAAAVLLASAVAGGCQRHDDDALAVVVSLPEQRLTGAAKVTVEVDYSATGASLVVENGAPSCAFILPGIEGDFSDDGKGKLTIHTQGPRAARGPADVAACRMKAGDRSATAADLRRKLTVRIVAAEDAAGKPVDVAAKSGGKAHGGPTRTEAEIEAAQLEAAKAAAAIAPSPASVAGGAPPPSTAQKAAAGLPIPAVSPATAAVIPKPSTPPAQPPRSVASGAGATSNATAPAPAPTAVDSSQIPGNADRDPGYDDSDADNPNLPAYDLEVAVTSEARLGALQMTITHLGSSGGFIGHNDQIDCVALVDAMMAANYSGERLAQLGLINIQGFRTPASVVRCGFRSREPLSPSSFLVQVIDASDAGAEPKPVDPEPLAAIVNITRR